MTRKHTVIGISLLFVLAMLTACNSGDGAAPGTAGTAVLAGTDNADDAGNNPAAANPSPAHSKEYRMADIVNEDSQRYDIQIDSRNTWIDAGARMSGEASSGATIQIVGGPSLRVSGSGDVVIKNGAIGQR